MIRPSIALAGALVLTLPGFANAADHLVEMRNRASDGTPMVFEPRLLRVQPGDTVTFVVKDKGHNSASVKGAIPEGAFAWNGKINQQMTVKIDVPGVYLYRCTPHVGMGMIGAIVAKEPVNLAAARSVRLAGKARKVADAIFAEIEAAQ